MDQNIGEKPDPLRVMKHHLKTPLTVVKGYLSFWKDDSYQKFPPEKQREFVLKSLEKSEELEKMINETFEQIQKEYTRKDDGE